MHDKLGWGIISTGRIAGSFARALATSRRGELVAVASRTAQAAEQFAATFKAPRWHASYEALLDDPAVQAVYIATPHPVHAEWAIRAAQAGKHILCEKPLTMNHAEAVDVIEAARRHDVFLMEAFMYRCHPQTHRLVELIRGGTIGEARVIQATFSFNAPYDPAGRIYANELGGGGILDVGCYCASMARLIAGVAAGGDFAEPTDVAGFGQVGPTGVDHHAVACLGFPGDIVANLATGVDVNMENVVRIFGSKGHVHVPTPWTPGTNGGTTRIHVHVEGKPHARTIPVQTDRWLFAIEADVVAENLDRRQARPPAMTWDDTLGNMKTLDRWRAAVGVAYHCERTGRA
ncbi:MAG: Gfo/Idh/MocA family oxidoreductase [Planctomycetes bacterium]|nr:Gfo/Idh/MocA family oxidoreductase [Planctomycetota bacterium]